MPFVGGVGAGGGGTSPFVEAADVISKVTASNQLVLQSTGTDEVQAQLLRGSDAAPAAEILQIRNAADAATLFSVDSVGGIRVPVGTTTALSISALGTPTHGLYFPGGNNLEWVVSGTSRVRLSSTGTVNTINAFNLGATVGASDTGIARVSAGILKVTDGSTGYGQLYLATGTAALPSLAYGLDVDTGLVFDAVGQMALSVASAYQLGFTTAGVEMPSTQKLGWRSTGALFAGSLDTVLRRRAAATLNLGSDDSATPVSQTLQVQGSRGGTDVDIAGGNLTVISGLGTGAAAASSIIFQTPTVTVSGSAQQAAATRLTISSTAVTSTVPYLAPVGAVAAPAFSFTAFPSSGMYRGVADSAAFTAVVISELGTPVLAALQNANGVRVIDNLGLCTASAIVTPDIGIARSSASVLKITNGTATAGGSLLLAGAAAAVGQEIRWASTAAFGAADVGLCRQGVGILKVTDGAGVLGRLGTITGTELNAAIGLGQAGVGAAIATGLYWSSGVNLTVGSVTHTMFRAGYIRTGSGQDIGWSSNANPTAAVSDVGLIRKSAGVLGITDGSTGGGDLFLASDKDILWSSTTTFGAADTGLIRAAAGELQLTDGAAGFGQLDLTRVLLGNGTSDASPVLGIILATAGVGTDIAGSGIAIRGGVGTGTGLGGAISFSYAPAAAGTGAGANTLQVAGQFDEGGVAGTNQYVGLFLGAGHKTATPTDGYLAAPEAAGTDIAGADLSIRGGSPTGSGIGGVIKFGLSVVGATGTAVRVQEDFAVIGWRLSDGTGGGLFLGRGHLSGTPEGGVLSAASAVGTDIAGANLNLYGGTGTGSGTPGNVNLSTPTAGTTGTTQQSLSLRAAVTPVGLLMNACRLEEYKGANVASAGDLTLGGDGNMFHITGTTQIDAIITANWQAGSIVYLIFDGALTVKNNTAGGAGTAPIQTKTGADVSTAAGDTMVLGYDGSNWYEF